MSKNELTGNKRIDSNPRTADSLTFLIRTLIHCATGIWLARDFFLKTEHRDLFVGLYAHHTHADTRVLIVIKS